MQKTPPLDLPRLKELIHLGINSIKVEQNTKEAILVIGDTGSGKSTIISFLSGCQLVIRYDGLKPTLDNVGHAPTKIGHDKYSETSVPKKIMIDGTALYDCPGFNDNKGEEYEISNSFFVQRLLDLH